ncbi:hypothetical protein ABK040_000926 [Willaertia magna]
MNINKRNFSYNSFVFHMPIFHCYPQQNSMSHNGSMIVNQPSICVKKGVNNKCKLNYDNESTCLSASPCSSSSTSSINNFSNNFSNFIINNTHSNNSNSDCNSSSNNNFVWTSYDFQKGSCNKTTNRNYNFKPSKIQKKKRKNKEIKVHEAAIAAVTITKEMIGGCDLNKGIKVSKATENKITTDKKNNKIVILKEEITQPNHTLEQRRIRTSISIKELLN